MKKRRTIADLERALAVEARETAAFREWFFCSTQGHATQELNIGDSIRVIVHGMTRASGGVAIVESGSFRDYPRLLDDLIGEWLRDSTEEIRAAARLLTQRRERQIGILSPVCAEAARIASGKVSQ